MEILVVLVIIGLLAGVVSVGTRVYLIKGKQNTARLQISNLCQALDTYYASFDRYPTTDQGLTLLTQPNAKLPEPLLKRVPLDPWGNSYIYRVPGRTQPYEILCLGADGKEGGSGADTDISSEALGEEGLTPANTTGAAGRATP